jgi:hypothetical protein
MDPEAVPIQLPVRRIPLAITDKVKKELDRLEKEGIIVPVTVPTNWVSALLVIMEMSGYVSIQNPLMRP